MTRPSPDEQPTTVLPQATLEQPTVATAPATRRARVWRHIPSRVGRARTSTLVIGCLFVLLLGLNAALPRDTGGTVPVTTSDGRTIQVPRSYVPGDPAPTPAPSPTTPVTTSAPATTAPATTTARPSRTSATSTAPEEDEATTAPATTEDEPGEEAPRSSSTPSTAGTPTSRAPTTTRAPASTRAPATTAAPTSSEPTG
jgi:hypothetical protein